MPSEKIALLLKGGTIYDGTGKPPYKADIGICGDSICFIGNAASADEVIDVGGLSVSPGFIDAHGHSEFTLLADPDAGGKILQGITTEINGNCGLSAAPLYGDALLQRENNLNEYGIKKRWHSFNEYFGLLEDSGLALNYLTLAGHGSIRASAMGYVNRPPDPREMKTMKVLLSNAVKEGAIGLSTGLIYPPGIYSATEEISELARHGTEMYREGFIYASHMRSEGASLLEAISEAISIGRKAGARVHISHIKTIGKENWRKIEGAIALIESARAEGIRVTCDRYPYTAGSTDLDSVLPSWVYEGGNAKELERLNDPGIRKRVIEEMEGDNRYWETVFISGVSMDKNRWMEGKNILEVADRLGMNPVHSVIRVLIEEDLRIQAIFHSMSEDNLKRFLSLPYVMLGTDSSARSLGGPTAKGKPHPRGFGSFPRFIRGYSSDLPEAVHKITMLPAETFGIKGRGRIEVGYKADLVVFDPSKISDTATYDNPFQPPEGIYHVMVNGVASVSDGKPTGLRAGRVLRGGG